MLATLGRILRTTAVRLSLVYLVVFGAVTLFLIGWVSYSTTEVLTRQIRDTIDAETRELEDEYQEGGLRRIVDVLETRSRTPGANLYLLADFSGNIVAGNITRIPPSILDDTDGPARPIPYTRSDTRDRDRRHFALARVLSLDGGFRLLVGRDLGEREQFRGVFRDAFRVIIIVMLVIGVVTWWFVSRRVLRRIDQVSEAGRRIVAGDLSGRLPVTGSGDEFDRLAESLNDMLGRIAELMRGLKEVSDNIAHDLKTPLTRMRNRVEAALAAEPDVDRYREALETTIEESSTLIKTFDALLMIARVEAGGRDAVREPVDVAEIARELCELYEPVAEEEGVILTVEAPGSALVTGSRELIAQGVANLVDNALKYGRAEGRPPAIRLSVARDADDIVAAVADNGPGIPEADRDRVRDRFVRLEASRSAPGSGLGLSLVEAIAHHHGGRLLLVDAGPGLRAELRLRAREPS